MIWHHRTLLSRIRDVRRRWRTQSLARGLALFMVSAVALLLLGIWGADLYGFSPPVVGAMRGLTAALTVFVAWRFLYVPLRRRISDLQVARFIEERYPQLQDRLVSAVEFGGSKAVSPGILDLLIHDALQNMRPLDLRVFLNHKRLVLHCVLGAGALLAFLALLVWGPSFLPYGFDRLYAPWLQAADHASLLIEVKPGNVELAQGSDQEFEARLVGFDSPDVRLMAQAEGKTEWESLPMEAEKRGSRFQYLMIDVQSSLHYYVEAGGIRSPSFEVTVLGLAHVEKIDATYDFPEYTGMPSQTVENEGDLSALIGTRISLNVQASKPAASARLLLDDESAVDLAPMGNLAFAGTLTLRRSGSYVVQFADAQGRFYAGSREYEMDAVQDEPPHVRITKPLRDVRATSVEEVFTEVTTEDDLGLASVELRFSINGAPEQTVGLFRGPPSEKDLVSTHTFFLEEHGLQPGDLVSYYARAADNKNVGQPGTASSDIYFIQIRPFENKYTQSQQAGMPGGGEGGMGGSESLSKQQKDIIAATFKLIRDREAFEAEEYEESLKALALVQSRLQLQAQNVVDRMTRRGASDVSQDFARLTEYLRAAVAEMQEAAVRLGAQKPSEALPQEQKALQQLLRAESLFLEIQISFASGQGGSGQGGSAADAEDLADLFELELNKLKNQYETVQRGERQQSDQKVDEAMERLKELAQRQQQLNERNRMLGQRGSSGGSSSAGGSQNQQQIMDEAEKLARQLQRLSRERSSAELSRVGNQLQQAIQEMRNGMQHEQAGRNAGAQGIRALQKLEDARRALSREQSAGLAQGLDRALDESRQLAQEQEKIQAGIERMTREEKSGNQAGMRQQAEDLVARKEVLAGRLRNLEGALQDMSKQARKSQPETSARLSDAASSIRDRRLPERILSGGRMLQSGYLEAVQGREEFIRSGLEDLHRRLEEAKNSVGQTKEGRLADALDKTRQLADGLESMQRRLRGLDRDRQADSQQSAGREATGRNAQPDPQGRRGEAGRQGGEEQRGRAPSGVPGRDSAFGQSLNAVGPPTGIGRYTEEDFRQLSREIQERLMDAQDLRRLLDRNITQPQNLEDVIQELRRLDDARKYTDPEEIARLKQAVELLRQLEIDLSRELSRLTQKDRYLYADDNGAPNTYRRLVEEYYKALARGKP